MSLPIFYTHDGFDRAAHRRLDADWLGARLGDGPARLVPLWRLKHLVASGAVPAPIYPALPIGDLPGEPVFLGLRAEEAYFALDLGAIEEADALAFAGRFTDAPAFLDLRQLGAVLPWSEGALLAYARALVHWRTKQRFCGVCGSPTGARSAGHIQACANEGCGTNHFPRTDPATIMLVTDASGPEPRCLLGRQPVWPKGMYSTLAGFVEPGESLEDAVIREVREEAGIEAHNVRYFASQPWPFPQALMLGFFAEARTTEIVLDGQELEDARWFTRPELRELIAHLQASLPRLDTIARRLMLHWLEAGT